MAASSRLVVMQATNGSGFVFCLMKLVKEGNGSPGLWAVGIYMCCLIVTRDLGHLA